MQPKSVIGQLNIISGKAMHDYGSNYDKISSPFNLYSLFVDFN